MIETLFPTLMYREILSGYNNNLISNYCEEIKNKHPATHKWRCNTYSSMNTGYEMLKDEYFISLITTVANRVGQFAQSYGMGDCDVHVEDSWINIAQQGAYQEYHLHESNHFSAVYYVKTPENCGDICFRSHEANHDMFPLITKEYNENNFKTMTYKAIESTLLIFRSNLLHMVEMNNSTENRISISMNFIVR